MAEKPTKEHSESDSVKHVKMPSEQAILELHMTVLHEYTCKRNLERLKKYLSPDITAIGSAPGEFWTNLDALLTSLQSDIEKIPCEITISEHSFKVERLNDICAVVWGNFSVKGETAEGVAFDNQNCQLTAVYCLRDGIPLVCHLHGSQLIRCADTSIEPWPLQALATRQHETSEKYRFILENAPVAIMQYDSDGYLKDYNAKFLTIFGTTAEKVAGLSLFDIADEQAKQALADAVNGRSGYYEGYYRSVTSDKVTPLKMITTPIYGADSKVIGGIAIVEDISENRVTQDRLRYQLQFEKMLSSIAQGLVNAPVDKIDKIITNALELTTRFFEADRGYVFQVSTDGRTITNTHEWCAANVQTLIPKYQNYPLANLPGVKDFISKSNDYLHFSDVTKMPESMAEFKKLLIEDSVRSILLMPMLTQGKFIGLFGYDCVHSYRTWNSEEITLLKVVGEIFSNSLLKRITDTMIRASDERYRFLSENINDIIWVFDVETRKYRYISPTLTRIFGFTPEELMQLEIKVHLPPESLKIVNDYLPKRLANLRNNLQTRYIDELDQLGKDGRLIHTEMTQNWVINKETGHAEIIGITRDVSERKELEQQKRQIETQKQQNLKADSLGRMASAIAHHFNNQLQVVLGNLELLGINRPLDEKCKKSVNDAMRATRKASEMSSMMLTYLGQYQAEIHTIDLTLICRTQIESLSQHLPARHRLELHTSISDALIRINRDQLLQIIRSAIFNASEASADRSDTIVLDIGKVASDAIPSEHRFPIDWTPLPDSTYVCLRILDHGRGIPEDEISKVFDPFFSTKGLGRGLGLPNSLGFMRGIGGGISLHSVPDHGSCFSFYFPSNAAATVETVTPAIRSGRILRVKTILVVEDEEMVRFITRSLLENFDYKVIEATDGTHAIEIFKALRQQIDLVICDLVMPGLDGWQTLTELRKISPDIPAIMASGYDKSIVMRGEHPEQPQAFICKPYNSKTLQEAIRQVISTV